MLRRFVWFRLLATFVGVWLPLTVGEPAALSLCTAHQGAATASTISPHGHGAAASAQSAEPAQHHTPPSDDAPHHCTCIGGCSASTATLSVPDVRIATVALAAVESAGFSATAAARTRPSPDYARPYTTGPPRA